MAVSGAGWKPGSLGPLYVRVLDEHKKEGNVFCSGGYLQADLAFRFDREKDVGRKRLILDSRGTGRDVEGGGMKTCF